jgi:hypothetical protein
MNQQPARTAPAPGATCWRTRALPAALRYAQGAVCVVDAVHSVDLVLVLTHWQAFRISVVTHHRGSALRRSTSRPSRWCCSRSLPLVGKARNGFTRKCVVCVHGSVERVGPR